MESFSIRRFPAPKELAYRRGFVQGARLTHTSFRYHATLEAVEKWINGPLTKWRESLSHAKTVKPKIPPIGPGQ